MLVVHDPCSTVYLLHFIVVFLNPVISGFVDRFLPYSIFVYIYIYTWFS